MRIIFLVAFCLALIFIYLDTGAAKLEGDAAIYTRIAKNIVSGNGFSEQAGVPYLPTMGREPVYPLFLAIIFYLFKNSIPAAQFFQAILYALTCVLLFRVINYISKDKKAGFIISLIIALFPTLANYSAYLITEVLFTFLLSAFVTALVISFKRGWTSLYFCSGLILGAASLCKAILIFLGIFIIPFIALDCYKKYRNYFIRKTAKFSVALLGGFFLIVSPWLMRNYFIFGKPTISLRGADTLYTRAAKVNLSPKELKMYAIYSLSEVLANKFYPGYNLNSISSGYFYKPVLNRQTEFTRRGISRQDADSLLRKEAIFFIKNHPFRFAETSIFEFIKFNSFSQILFLNSERANGFLGNDTLLSVARGMLKIFGFLIVALAVAGILMGLRQNSDYLVFVSIILYFNLVHLVVDAVGRYAAPIIPYYLFFAGLVFINKKCAE